jgi:ribosomal protein L37AE/L43A
VIVVVKLRCSKCGKVFDKKAITDYDAAGVTGARVGVRYDLLMWPFTMRAYATCPICNEKGWLKVLPPWKKE